MLLYKRQKLKCCQGVLPEAISLYLYAYLKLPIDGNPRDIHRSVLLDALFAKESVVLKGKRWKGNS